MPTWGAERWREERAAGLALPRLRVPLLNAVGPVARPHGQRWAGLCPASVGLAVERQHPTSVGLAMKTRPGMEWDGMGLDGMGWWHWELPWPPNHHHEP